MRYLSTILLSFVLAGILYGQDNPTPSDLLHEALNEVVTQVMSDTAIAIPDSSVLYPALNGDMESPQESPAVNFWRQSWQEEQFTVFVTEQPEIYRVILDISRYQFHLEKAGKIRLFKKRDYSGTFELSGTVTVISPNGKMLGTTPVAHSTGFDPSGNLYFWRMDETGKTYPISWSSVGDNPGLATVLLSVTSGVIIYLFYVMRG